MGWIRIDNGLGSHTKALKLSEEGYLSAIGLLVLCIAHADQQRTDGFIPKRALQRIAFGDYETPVAELVNVGFLEEAEGGYQIHDYLKWQMSREQIEARSESQRQKALSMHAKRAAGNADGSPAGNAYIQDDTSDTSILDDTTPPGQISDLVALSNRRLNTLQVQELLERHGYERVVEAIRRAKSKGAKEHINNFNALVSGIAEKLEESPTEEYAWGVRR